ncbi:MAG: ribbon-helix-helix protein, CopG family [SAR202 cluster bacterium]|nr:ribbon-helix-helix protein, CopG family [SAR202 cluster bacterium]
MAGTAKIAISLPEKTLAAVERRRRTTGESRSQYVRRAVESLTRIEQEREWDEQMAQSYRENPETQEELEALRKSASILFAQYPWE